MGHSERAGQRGGAPDKHGRAPPANFSGLWSRTDASGATWEFEYVDGVKHGRFRHIRKSGVTYREGEFEAGLEHGTFVVRSAEGGVVDRETFVRGTGTHRLFTSDGQLGWEIPMVGGKRHGLVRRYRRGRLLYEQEWVNGVPGLRRPA